MSITIFTPLEKELFELVSNSDVILEFDEASIKAPIKTVVIIDMMSIIELDSEKWVSIDYSDIDKIANEIAMNVIHS